MIPEIFSVDGLVTLVWYCRYSLEGADVVNTSFISPSSKRFNSSKWMLKTGIQIPTVNHKFDPLALFQDLNMTLVQR